MWDNLARTVVEYAQLDTYWRQDDPAQSRVIKDAASTQVVAGIKAAKRRTLHFSLHSANWEIVRDRRAAARRQSAGPIPPAEEPAADRRSWCASGRGRDHAAGRRPVDGLGDQKKFGEGDALGMLIDQHYAHGIEVKFFGRPTKLNPLFARLVRIYDCPVYGSRIIRRPDRRFGYEIVGPIEPARDARGRVDVQATTQIYASLLERWIREHPEQWLWLHRIWR